MISKYPHVVIRWAVCVYGSRQVEFVAEAPALEPKDIVTVVDSAPYENGKLTEAARSALIEKLKILVRESRFRMCAVFGKHDSVFVELDGTVKVSGEPPSGGIVLDQMQVRRGNES